jgi:hypothetical protein
LKFKADHRSFQKRSGRVKAEQKVKRRKTRECLWANIDYPHLSHVKPGRESLTMAKHKPPQVIFKLKRVEEGDWQIDAHCPGGDIRSITAFKTKAEVDEWMNGARRIDWLRSQGYAK